MLKKAILYKNKENYLENILEYIKSQRIQQQNIKFLSHIVDYTK